ncbi:MAG TPA: catalase family protein [Dokdonella sp.]
MSALYATPLRFDPSMEQPEPDEAATFADMAETLRSISRKTFEDSGHGLRSVHAKSHGLLDGTLVVLPDLPQELAQGVFASEGQYPVVIRLSTTPGDVLDDKVSTPRGVGIKLFASGDPSALAGDEGLQDFLLVNAPTFGAASAKAFLKNLKLLAPTTDKAEGLKKALAAVLRGVEKTIESVGGESGTLKSLGGHPLTHILGETFYSQVPLSHGPYAAKLRLAPTSSEMLALTNARVDLSDHPNGLRDAVVAFCSEHPLEWELGVQLCTDLESMPIEDSSARWPEEKSPFVAVARIHVPMQSAWSDERSPQRDERLFFNPWHCTPSHRPLGSIMRARRVAYAASAEFRRRANAGHREA